MTKICLVTGGAGFIGSAISSALVSNFDRVVVVDHLHPQIHFGRGRPMALDSRVHFIEADIALEGTWDQVLRDDAPDVVIHLAAETGTGQSLTEGTRHAYANVLGLTRMLDAIGRTGVLPRRIVLASSRAVYGEGAWEDPVRHELVYPGQRTREMLERGIWNFAGLRAQPFSALATQTRPTSIYGATKLAQENILQSWALAYGTEIPILRLQNVYGPGQSLENSYTGIVSLFVKIARAGGAIPIYEDGEIIRDFVFIDDVVDAIVKVACGPSVSTTPYDIGSGIGTSILALGRTIAKIYDAPSPVINGRFRHGDVRHAACVLSRSIEELDWQPTCSLERGLSALCAWVENCS